MGRCAEWMVDPQEFAAAIAVEVVAVKFDERIFVLGEGATGAKDADAAGFAGGKFREAGVERDHGNHQ